MAMPTGSTSSSTTEPQQYAATEAPERCPTHPGELFREILTDGLKLSVAEAARQLGVSRMTLHRLLRGEQAVTPEMALRLGKLCGNGPEFWLRLQMQRDLWRLERRLAADLARIPTHRAA
jgi:addiction module HigA family antidote